MNVSEHSGRGAKIVRRVVDMRGQIFRFRIQLAFLLLCIWIGVEFILWVESKSGTLSWAPARPPGVEGFLPISSLMSLWYWIRSGEFHPVHPAGTVILIAVIGLSVILKKSFCSWLCPVGFISESVGDFGKKIFGRNFRLPGWIDLPLRSIKYLLLAFLAWVVFVQMDIPALARFLDSPYNRVADVKMYLFFRDISTTSLIVLGLLIGASLFIRQFWCRYLCPYGALLGLAGLASPFRITRKASTCIDCAKCAKVCPAAIAVDRKSVVLSDECTTCLACVDVCPVADTLELRATRTRGLVRPRHVAIAVAVGFMLVTGAGMLLGRWKSSVSDQEYTRRIQDIQNPIYQHNMGRAPAPHGSGGGGVRP